MSMYVSSEDALSVIPLLPHIYDEPFADQSQIPTYLVSKMAKEHVTVCLSGDASDELFGGYSRHIMINDFWSKIESIPYSLRKILARIIQQAPHFAWDLLNRLPTKKYLNIGEKNSKSVCSA